MLLRAYRLTDRLTLIFLKTLSGMFSLTAEGAALVLGRPTGQRAGLLGLLGLIAQGIAVMGGFLLAGIMTVVGAATRIVGLGASTASSSARTGMQGAMARRAAQQEMRAAVREDPLRTRNRTLSALLVLTLAGVIAIVLWATQPRPQSVAVLPPDLDSALALSTPVTTTPGVPVAVPTAFPTSTNLPEVLSARGTIAYTLRENGQNDLWVIPITSRTPLRITNDAADERDPAWSPDGSKLAYSSNQDGNWEIYIYDFLTQQTRRMTFSLAFEAAPSWSPDGNWLVYETYQNGSFDIYVLPVTDLNASLQPITNNASPNMRPAWSPDGRQIAFVSWRDGSGDILIVSLEDISSPVNITRSANIQEDYPAWSPDSAFIAYSALDAGLEKVFVQSVENPDMPPVVLGRGRAPSWSPDGRAIIAAVDSTNATHLTVYPFGVDSNAVPQIVSVPARANHPTWTSQPLPLALINNGGLPATVPVLYTEQETRFANGLYPLGSLTNNVQAPSARLSDRVNDSFNALRERVLNLSGRDFLGRLDDAFWDVDQRPQPGEDLRNWHKTGRAFSINKTAALVGFPPDLEIIREDVGIDTRWHVYLRVAEDAQDGQLGEPLRGLPWDFESRTGADVGAYEAGGKFRETIPQGYYIDLTEIAADYGWQPYPAGADWRLNFNAINYWMFIKPDGLDWLAAMRELWTDDQLGGFVPTPRPPVIPTDSGAGG